MPHPLFTNSLPTGSRALIGESKTAVGSSIIVAHSDAKTSTQHATDPWKATAGTGTGTTAIRPIVVPNAYTTLELSLLWYGTPMISTSESSTSSTDLQPTVSVAPVVRVFGLVPQWPGGPVGIESNGWPYADDNEFPNLTSWWMPLTLISNGSVAITLSNTVAMTHDGDEFASNDFYVGLPSRISLAGATRFIVTISTAATLSIPGAAMVLARMISHE